VLKVKLVAVTRHLGEDESIEALITRAGRICYKSESTGDAGKFIRARIRQGHLSILEHGVLSYEISGMSRSCLAQLTRHRIASYSVQSLRRVGVDSVDFAAPPGITGRAITQKIFDEAIEAATASYISLRELGVKKEDCRFLLPLATETELVLTMNVHALRKFFQTRLDRGAQWEIRALAVEMLKLAYKEVPSAFEDLYTVHVKGKDL